jgi:ubiquinone/menaquinone biosynthesis C-methylase UbiE
MRTLEETREAWDRLAAGYDQFTTPISIGLAEQALGLVELRPGMRLLDVGAGSGALSIPAARLGATVTATDLSPVMIAQLNERARHEGLTEQIEGRVMDGHALELDDDVVDVAASQNGVSLLPDLRRGLRELVRATKPGGQVLIVAFGPPSRAEFLGFFLAALQVAVPGFTGPPMDPPPLPFQAAHPATLREQLTDASLTDVRVERINWAMPFQSASHFWAVVTTSNPMGAALAADLTPNQRTAVQQLLDGMLRERSGGGPAAVLHTDMNLGIGRK